MHFPEVVSQGYAMLDHAQAGDSVKKAVGERSSGKIAGKVADGTAARWISEREIDPVEIAVPVGKQRRENVAVKFRPSIQNARRSRSACQDGRHGCKMVPIFLLRPVEWDVESACILKGLDPL